MFDELMGDDDEGEDFDFDDDGFFGGFLFGEEDEEEVFVFKKEKENLYVVFKIGNVVIKYVFLVL